MAIFRCDSISRFGVWEWVWFSHCSVIASIRRLVLFIYTFIICYTLLKVFIIFWSHFSLQLFNKKNFTINDVLDSWEKMENAVQAHFRHVSVQDAFEDFLVAERKWNQFLLTLDQDLKNVRQGLCKLWISFKFWNNI